MGKRVNFEFSKDSGSVKKGTTKVLDVAFARSLQDIRKVGKIKGEVKSDDVAENLLKENEALKKRIAVLEKAQKPKAEKPKAQKPASDKTDKTITSRSIKR